VRRRSVPATTLVVHMTRIQYIPQVTSDGRQVILHGVPDPPAQRLRELWRRLTGGAARRRRPRR